MNRYSWLLRLLRTQQSRSDVLLEQRASGAFYDRRLPWGCETVCNLSLNLVEQEDMRCHRHSLCLYYRCIAWINIFCNLWTKILLVFSLCFRCCRKKAATFDQHLYWLFDDLRNSEAKTHNIVKNLGITNGQFGFKASLPHFFKILQTKSQCLCFLKPCLSVYVQRDAAEYFEKILCLTSLGAAKVSIYFFDSLKSSTYSLSDIQCWASNQCFKC